MCVDYYTENVMLKHFALHKASDKEIELLVEAGLVQQVPVYTMAGADRAEELHLLRRSS